MKKASSKLLAALLAIVVCGCSPDRVYDEYHPTPMKGWEKTEPVIFHVPPVSEAGDYRMEIGLRTTMEFPFTTLILAVAQEVFPSVSPSPSVSVIPRSRSTFLTCRLIEDNGRSKGNGLSIQQHSFPADTLRLQAGDSLVVSVRHDMKREILPGVCDVGMTLTPIRR